MYKVLAAFKDAENNNKEYNVGDTFQSQDEQRIATLVEKHFIVKDLVQEQQSQVDQINSAVSQQTQSDAEVKEFQAKDFQTKTPQAKGKKAKEAGE